MLETRQETMDPNLGRCNAQEAELASAWIEYAFMRVHDLELQAQQMCCKCVTPVQNQEETQANYLLQEFGQE